MANDVYWLHKSSSEVASYMSDYDSTWYSLTGNTFRQAWIRNYIAYYSPLVNQSGWDTSLLFQGVQGELIKMYTPKARVYISKTVSILTKQRLAFQAMCQTRGGDVVETAKLANALSDQIIDTQRLDLKVRQALECAMVTGCGFFETIWRTDRGQPWSRDEQGNLIFTGGVEITTPTIFDVTYDVLSPYWETMSWCKTRVIDNRYDLIAQFPHLETEILALPSIREYNSTSSWLDRSLDNDDLVYSNRLYARPSAALPKGRLMIYGDEKTIYTDGINIYGTIPVEPLMPETMLGTAIGYPLLSNLLPSQEMYDNSISAIATNQAQFAVQSVTIPRGSNVNVNELNGMRFIAFTPQNVPGGGKPEPLQLSQSAPETFKFIEMLDKNQQDLSGIGGILQGNPPPGVTSGTAIATVTANALESNDGPGKAYSICLEKTMMHAVNSFRLFAKIPQQISYKGRNGSVRHDNFTGEQLAGISGIKMIATNPMMQTISGRVEIATQLMQIPQEFWPKYTSIIEGRPLQEIYQPQLSSEDLIQTENDALMRGEPAQALATDDHPAHIQAHAGLLNEMSVRSNGHSVQNILNHMMEHYNLAKTTDPELSAMVRTGKMPDIPQQQAPTGPPPGPPAGGPPHGAPPGIENTIAGPPGALQALATAKTAEPAHDLLDRPREFA